jgi:uncharacterized protein
MNLWDIAAIDQHAHNLVKPEAAASVPYVSAFTEGSDPEILTWHARQTLFFRRSVREIAQLLECDPTEDAIVARRQELGAEDLAARCFHAAHLGAIFLDDGFLSEKLLPWEWHRRFVPVRRIVRLESLAETLLREESRFEDFRDRFRASIDRPAAEVVALKTIAAYRSGLKIDPVTEAMARTRFTALKQQAATASFRLEDKIFIDFIVSQALDAAVGSRLPVQFHTGFGDPELDLRLANPLHLRPLLASRRHASPPVVMLHAGYPFVREAAYLASVTPHAYVDIGLALPFLSVAGMRRVLQQLLELCPVSKLMFSSDAHIIPELYYLGAKWGREALGEVLDNAIKDSDLTAAEAEHAAKAILAENANRLYLAHKLSTDRSE